MVVIRDMACGAEVVRSPLANLYLLRELCRPDFLSRHPHNGEVESEISSEVASGGGGVYGTQCQS